MLIRFVKTYMHWLDPLSSMQKKLAMFHFSFWKKSGKLQKVEEEEGPIKGIGPSSPLLGDWKG